MAEKFGIMVKGIVRYDGKYLLLKRWYDDNISAPYRWVFADGIIEFGEDPEIAVHRVIESCTGLEMDGQKIKYTWSFVLGETHYVGLCYLCEAGSDIVMLGGDFEDYQWVHENELLEYIDNENMKTDMFRAGIISRNA